MFIDVATFGAQADACAKYLTKGRAVAVTGRLVYREWDDNGTRRSRHHIVGRVQFGGSPNGAHARQRRPARGGRPEQRPAPAATRRRRHLAPPTQRSVHPRKAMT